MEGNIKGIKDISDLEGVRVLLRSELNAPQFHGKVVDDSRLQASLGTIKYLTEKGARVIIIAHASALSKDERLSLEPIYQYLKKEVPISFVREYAHGEAYHEVSELQNGEIILFENLRFDPREEEGNLEFAKTLSTYGDLYINDAFPVSHRAHASITGIPHFLPSYAGVQFMAEYDALSKALDPEHPFLFILGGAKFETKLPLAEVFLDKADTVFLGGALMNPLFKERGYEVGHSLVPAKTLSEIPRIAESPALMLPRDVISVQGGEAMALPIGDMKSEGHILDVGPESVRDLKKKIAQAKFILWNGPLGDFERGFRSSTDEIARAVRESNAISIVGGGDSIASLEKTEGKDFSFVSTAGGAMLDFLAHNGNLPGITALRQAE